MIIHLYAHRISVGLFYEANEFNVGIRQLCPARIKTFEELLPYPESNLHSSYSAVSFVIIAPPPPVEIIFILLNINSYFYITFAMLFMQLRGLPWLSTDFGMVTRITIIFNM